MTALRPLGGTVPVGRFIRRKGEPITLAHLMSVTVEGPGGCWLWTRKIDPNGYGHVADSSGRIVGVHRLAWTMIHGPIDGDLTVDHICFVRHCLNPGHLQLLSPSANSGRQRRALSTHCARGHEFTPGDTGPRGKSGIRRRCRTCRAQRRRGGAS